MASSTTYDESTHPNSLYFLTPPPTLSPTLPLEVQRSMLASSPIQQLVNKDYNGPSIVHDAIIAHIESGNILQNQRITSYLYESKYYKNFVDEQFHKISLEIAGLYSHYSELFPGGAIMSLGDVPFSCVKLSVNFSFVSVGPHFKGDTGDFTKSIVNLGKGDGVATLTFKDTMYPFDNTLEAVAYHIYMMFVNNCVVGDTVAVIKKIHFTREYYPAGLRNSSAKSKIPLRTQFETD